MGRSVLGQDQHVAAQDVIHIDALLWQHIDKWQVACCLDDIAVQLGTADDQAVFIAFLPLAFSSSMTMILPSAAFDDSADFRPSWRTFFGNE